MRLAIVAFLALPMPLVADEPLTSRERTAATFALLTAHQLEKAGDLDAARARYDEILQLYPRYDRAYFARAGLRLKKGDPDGSIADLTTAIELNPREALAFTGRGKVWIEKKDDDRAIADFGEAIRLSPDNPINYMDRAGCLIRKGDNDRASADLGRYITLRPSDPEGYSKRGHLRLNGGENHRSTFDFDEAIRLDPKHTPAYIGRARARRNMKEYDRAAADADEAIRLAPTLPQGYAERGELHVARAEWPQAESDFSEAVRLAPDNPRMYHSRAWIRATCPDASVRNGEQAVSDARRACELTNWKEPAYLDTLAAAEAECGRFAEAIRYVNQALQSEPYAKGKSGDGARWRRKVYEEGKAYREGAPAEVPGVVQSEEMPPEKVAAQYVFFGAVGLVVLSMVAFRLRRFGVFPFRRRPVPADPPAEPPVTPE